MSVDRGLLSEDTLHYKGYCVTMDSGDDDEDEEEEASVNDGYSERLEVGVECSAIVESDEAVEEQSDTEKEPCEEDEFAECSGTRGAGVGFFRKGE